MQLKSSLALTAAALSAQAAAEFIVLTDIPQALQTLNAEQVSHLPTYLPITPNSNRVSNADA